MNLHTNLDLTLLGWDLGAVFGISAVSATFSRIFPAFRLGFGCCFRSFRDYSSQVLPSMPSTNNDIRQKSIS